METLMKLLYILGLGVFLFGLHRFVLLGKFDWFKLPVSFRFQGDQYKGDTTPDKALWRKYAPIVYIVLITGLTLILFV